MDYQDCMLGYGSVVRWELTEEEKRNLRNFVKRNGGKMPKYRPLKSVSSLPISPAPEAEAKTTVVEKVEQEMVVLLETVQSAAPPINTLVRQIETEEELPQPLNKRFSKEVFVTPPMKYEAGRLTMNGEGLPFRKAKALSRVSDSDAFRHFRRAGILRGWNFLWGYTSAAAGGSRIPIKKLVMEIPQSTSNVIMQNTSGLSLPSSMITSYKFDIGEDMFNYPGELLWMHGTADKTAPFETAKSAMYMHEGSYFTEAIYEAIGHGLRWGIGDDEWSRVVLYFIRH